MKVAALALVCYAALVLLVIVLQRSMIYFPPRDYPVTPRDLGFDFEEADLVAEDGVSIKVWHVPGPAKDSPVLLYFHGNAANLSSLVGLMPSVRGLGFSFAAVDYRGYGRSGGSPSEEGLHRDAIAAYGWLRSRNVEQARIFAYGQSLGAAVASRLAACKALAGVVLEGSFPSTYAMARHHYRWLFTPEWVIRDKFETRRHVTQLTCPVLVIHGEEDLISPLRFGEAVYAAAAGAKFLLRVPGAGHNSISADLPEVRRALEEFRAFCLKNRAGGTADSTV